VITQRRLSVCAAVSREARIKPFTRERVKTQPTTPKGRSPRRGRSRRLKGISPFGLAGICGVRR